MTREMEEKVPNAAARLKEVEDRHMVKMAELENKHLTTINAIKSKH